MAEQAEQQPPPNNTSPAESRGAVARRDGLLTQETTLTVETAAMAVAAQARAAIEARYVMAMRRPRDIEDVRQAVLKECRRPGFADVALYSKPVGGKAITGLSIRFAEVAVRAMRNIEIDTPTVYDDPQRRIVKVIVVDLEANVPYSRDIVIEKTVERRNPSGREVFAQRRNTQNQNVFIVAATEDEVATKEANLISKAIRNLVLRLLPGDIQEEARATVEKTLKDRAAKDPDAERKQIADAFATLNVRPSDLREYLGHELDKSTPAELVRLRQIYASLRDGEASWADIVEDKRAAATATKDATDKKTEDLKREHDEKKAGGDQGGAKVDTPAATSTAATDCDCPAAAAGVHLETCPHHTQEEMFPGTK